MNESLPVHDRFRSLRTALLAYRLDGRGELFHSRDMLRELGDWVGESALASFQPLLELALEVLGQVIRNDGLGKEEALLTTETLVEFVESALNQASADRPQKLGMAAAETCAAGPAAQLGGTGFYRAHPVPSSASAPAPAPARAPTPAPAPDAQPAVGYEVPTQREIHLDADAVDETRLGEILLKMNLIPPAELTRALSLQQVTRKRLGEILLAMGVIDEFRLRDALERQRHATLRMAQGLAQGARGGLELRVAHPDFLRQTGRAEPGMPHAG